MKKTKKQLEIENATLKWKNNLYEKLNSLERQALRKFSLRANYLERGENMTREEYITLDTKQCAEIALKVYEEYEKAMEPPVYMIIPFKEWLADLSKDLTEK